VQQRLPGDHGGPSASPTPLVTLSVALVAVGIGLRLVAGNLDLATALLVDDLPEGVEEPVDVLAGGAGADAGPDGGGRQTGVGGEQVAGQRVGAEQSVAHADAVVVGEAAGERRGVVAGDGEADDADPSYGGPQEQCARRGRRHQDARCNAKFQSAMV